MPIARKPNRPSPVADPAVDIDALIHRGGAPAGAAPAHDAKPAPILLRIPAELIERLDRALELRPVKLPRHTWILEAIHEKLTRETDSR
jgi:hypothetical protein